MTALGQGRTTAELEVEAILRGHGPWQSRSVVYEPAGVGIISPSHRGVDAKQWAISLDGAPPAYLLKIFHADMSPFIDVGSSHEATAQAAELGITPRPVFANDGALVVEMLAQWHTATMGDLREMDLLAKVIAAKKRFRNSPRLARSTTIFDRLRAIRQMLEAEEIALPPDIWWLQAGVDDAEKAIEAAGFDAVPSHADGLASNVMYSDAGDVQLVDFDDARNVDPYFELGILLNEAFVFDSEMCPALEAFEGSVRRGSLARCRIYAVADDLYWGLWSWWMDARSPRGGLEFQKYANWRLLRCRMALRHPGFEERLRQI